MPSRRVRMIDVAQAAGVSRTTASFVLNGRDAGIPPETQQRVLLAARQLGYRPNATALALVTGRTHRIGIVLNEPESFRANDLYFSNVLAGVTSGAVCHNYNLLLHSAHYPDWQALYADILSGASDGTLLIGRYASDQLTPALLDTDVPVVCISYQIDHQRCYAVDCDNEEGAYLAFRHLIDLGHRQFAFFYPGHSVSWGCERYLGALRALDEASLPSDALHVYEWPETALPSLKWVHSAISFLQSVRPRPTALVCCEEARALHLVERLPGAGVRVPDDLAVVSFNSTELSALARPSLTSIWQPLKEIGAAAVDMLIDLIEERDVPQRCRRFPVSLHVRESSGTGMESPRT